jgi:dipeptidyl aminopeptidase/acylaminoacyl peptidase
MLRSSRAFLLGCVVLPLAPAPSTAQPTQAAQQRFTLDHFRRIVGVGGVQLSPDGRTAVITVSRPNYETDRFAQTLYAVDVATGATRQLTWDRRTVASASFSPNGRTLSFLAPDSAGRMQIWLLPMDGGESRRLTAHPTGVEHYSWRPDGDAIAFAATDSQPKPEGERRHLTTFTVGAQDLFLREVVRPQHIWLVDVKDRTTRRLTSGTWSLEFVLPPGSSPSSLSWSNDGRTIAFAQAVAPESGKLDSVHVCLLDVATGAIRPLTSARRFENNPVFSPDGRTVAYWYPREGRGDLGWTNEVWIAPISGAATRSLTRALDRNLFGAQWMPDGKALLVTGNDRTTTGMWIQPVDGAARRIDVGDLVINGAFGYDVAVAAHAPTIAFTATEPDRPSELYVMDSETARPRRLTDFNAWARDIAWGRLERVTWKSGQWEADGVVGLPAGFSPDKKYPLVLYIHGGPTSASKLNFSAVAQLMMAEGWVVFQPNYRGSDNLGNAYQASIIGDAGAGPGRDVMAGVAMLRQRPYVDRTRTAATGWSYGGFMTSWLIGNYPTEWRAAVAGAPVTSWEDMYNFGETNLGMRYTLGGSPWTDNRMQSYRDQSPITYATKIRTPTLVMSNMEDFRVPPTQAFALYRAMKDNGVETDFVAFTGRTHASSDPVNAMERSRLWLDWVKRHFASTVP